MSKPAWHPWPAGAARSPHRSPRPRSRERGLAPARSFARSPTTPSTRIRVRPLSRSCHQDVPQASPKQLQCPSPQYASFLFLKFLIFAGASDQECKASAQMASRSLPWLVSWVEGGKVGSDPPTRTPSDPRASRSAGERAAY